MALISQRRKSSLLLEKAELAEKKRGGIVKLGHADGCASKFAEYLLHFFCVY